MSEGPRPAWRRARAALRLLAGSTPGPLPRAGDPLPADPDLWPLCDEAVRRGHAPLPAGDAGRARDHRLACSVEGLRLMREARRARTILRDAGVRAVPWKGAALQDDFPSPGLRPMNDVDLLVRADLLEDAVRALEAGGHVLHPEGFRSPATVPLVDASGRSVDLHSRLLNPRIPLYRALARDDPARWWREVEGDELRPAAHLVVVGAHAMKHGFVKGRWLLDLAVLGSRVARDGELGRALAVARDQGLGALLRVPLALLRDPLGIRVPPALARTLGTRTPGEDLLLAALRRGNPPPRQATRTRLLPLVPGAGARLEVLLATAFPSRREVRERHGFDGYAGFLWARLRTLVGAGGAGSR